MGIVGKKHRNPKQKLEVVQLYLMMGGNVSRTARALNIPDQTVYTWRKTEWWNELENSIRREENLALSARLKRVLEKGMEAVEDRLEHGDWIYDQKTGKLARKPVAFRDAQKAVNDIIDKKAKLETTQQLTVAAEHIEDKLAKLANAFAKMTQPQINVTDVVFVEEKPQEDEYLDLPLLEDNTDAVE